MKKGIILLSLAALLGAGACKQTRPIPQYEPEIVVRDIDKVEDFLAFYDLKPINKDYKIRTQSGEIVKFREHLAKSMKELQAIDYVVVMLHNFREMVTSTCDLEENLEQQDFGQTFIDELRKDLSEDYGKGKYVKGKYEVNGDSKQTLAEFVENNYEGDCDDFAMALQTAYELSLEITAKWSNDNPFWANLNKGLSQRRIYSVRGEDMNSNGRHVLNVQFNFLEPSLTGIKPQIFESNAKLYFRHGKMYINDQGTNYSVWCLFDSKQSFQVNKSRYVLPKLK